jgi:hypothetical protein
MTTSDIDAFNRMIATIQDASQFAVKDCETVIAAIARTKADQKRRAIAFRVRDELARLMMLAEEIDQ